MTASEKTSKQEAHKLQIQAVNPSSLEKLGETLGLNQSLPPTGKPAC